MPDFRSAWEAKIREAEARDPGRLTVDIEAGKDVVVSPEQFRDVLEKVVRIAQINARANG